MVLILGFMMNILNEIKDRVDSNSEGDILYKKWDTHFKDDDFDKVYWGMFPMTEKYYFKGNFAYYYEFKDFQDMSRYPVVTLRDGYVGLLELFLNSPVPPDNFDTKILISKKFEKLVPSKWSRHIATYSISSRNKLKKDPKTCVAFGIATEDLFWHGLDKKLNTLQNLSKDKKLKFLIPQTETVLSDKKFQDNSFNVQFLKKLFQNFGFEIEIYQKLEKLMNSLNGETFEFFDLNSENVFIGDNFLQHYFYSVGGSPINIDLKLGNNKLTYNLSPFHCVEIEELNLQESRFAEFFLPFKVLSRDDIVIYDLYQSKQYQQLFIKHFG